MQEDIIKKNTQKKKYECDKCEFKFTEITEMKRHRKENHERKKYICTQCEFTFDTKTMFNTHVK